MTVLGFLKKYKKLYYPDDPVTYMEGLEISKLIWGTTRPQKIGTIISYIIWTLGFLHFVMKVIMDWEVMDMQVAMEALHWAAMHCLGLVGGTSLTLKSNTFRKLHTLVKSGVFSYEEGFSETQKRELSEERERIHYYVKVFFNAIFVAFVCTQAKGVLFDSHEWGVQFPGYFPFTINSYETYAVGLLFQFVLGYNIVITAQAFAASYSALSSHFCSQIRILSLSLEDILREPKDPISVRRRLRACVQHHNIVIEFHRMLQQFYSIQLLALSTAIVSMLCLALYVVTDPDSELIVIIPLLSVLVPEMVVVSLVCYAGQRIMNESENLTSTIYNIKWYNEAPHFTKDLIWILMKSQKTFMITGAGLQKYNLEGLAEILQSSYTYFNMLVALRKK